MECHSRVLNAAQLLNFGGVRELRPQQKHQSAPQMDLGGTFTSDLHLAGANEKHSGELRVEMFLYKGTVEWFRNPKQPPGMEEKTPCK